MARVGWVLGSTGQRKIAGRRVERLFHACKTTAEGGTGAHITTHEHAAMILQKGTVFRHQTIQTLLISTRVHV